MNFSFLTSYLFTFILIFTFYCGDIDIIRHREGDKKRREQYQLRQLLCHVPYQATMSSNSLFDFSNSISYASAHFVNSKNPYDFRYPNVAFSVDKAQSWKYYTLQEKLISSTIGNSPVFYALSPNHIYVSENSGETWASYPLPISNLLDVEIFFAIDSNRLVLIPKSSENNLQVFASLDRGKSWQNQELDGKNFIYFKSFSDQVYRILVSASSKISNVKLYTSYDYGQTWNLTYIFSSGSTSDYSPNYLYFYNSMEGFASGGTSIFKTIDGGLTWTEYPQHYPFDYTAVFYATSSVVYSSKHFRRQGNSFPRFTGIFAQSMNNGQDWYEFPTKVYDIHEVYSPNEIVGTASKTESGIFTFSSFTSAGIKTQYPRFLYEETTTLWKSNFYICWLSALFVPVTGTRSEERRQSSD